MCSTRVQTEADAFWDYGLSLYEREGVAPALIAAQDRLGADVNVVLLSCWLAARFERALGRAEYAKLELTAGPWRGAVTEPLRCIRRRLKSESTLAGIDGADTLRKRLLGVELDSERVAQSLLVSACAPFPTHSLPSPSPTLGRRVAEASLAVYFEGLTGAGPDGEFPDRAPPDAEQSGDEDAGGRAQDGTDGPMGIVALVLDAAFAR